MFDHVYFLQRGILLLHFVLIASNDRTAFDITVNIDFLSGYMRTFGGVIPLSAYYTTSFKP
jgi:hypothetical protein